MDLAGVQSPQMDWEAENLPERWKRFRQHVELMFSGSLSAKKEEEKCSYLLIWCGEKGRDIVSTWSEVSNDDKKKLATYFTRFEAHAEPKSNPVFSRYKFHNRVQSETETVEQFATDLKLLAKDCEFKEPEEMIRDRIVFATNSQKIREKLINQGRDLTLEKAVDIARTYEVSRSQLKSMASSTEVVHGISQSQQPKKGTCNPPSKERVPACSRCGKTHARDSCPATGKTCLKCGRANHFARMCKTPSRQVHKVSDTGDSLFVESISDDKESTNEVFVDIDIENVKETISFKLDTGAQVNVIPLKLFHQLKCENLEKTTQKLRGHGWKPLYVEEKCTLTCKYKGISERLEFFVVSTQAPLVLGLSSWLSLKLIKLILSVNELQEI